MEQKQTKAKPWNVARRLVLGVVVACCFVCFVLVKWRLALWPRRKVLGLIRQLTLQLVLAGVYSVQLCVSSFLSVITSYTGCEVDNRLQKVKNPRVVWMVKHLRYM